MEVIGVKSKYAFVRNPVVISEQWPSDGEWADYLDGSFYVKLGNRKIYEGRFSNPLRVDIAEVLDSSLEPFAEPPAVNSEPLILIESTESVMQNRSVYFNAEFGTVDFDCEFIALPGGVSRQNFRRYRNADSDAFEARFLNPRGNFFLTTRTASWCVTIKETELYPLYFIMPEVADRIVVEERTFGTKLLLDRLEAGSIYALDIAALRMSFIREFGVMPSVFDIYMGGRYSCRIVVAQADTAKQRCRIKFRNSLGVFEILDFTGTISVTPEYPEAEETAYMRPDEVAGGFISCRDRMERKQSLTVTTGVMRADAVAHIMDLRGSDEVELLDWAPEPVKVIPSAENMTYGARPEVPESFTLKLEVADADTNILPDIANIDDSRKPSVFTNHFTEQFY